MTVETKKKTSLYISEVLDENEAQKRRPLGLCNYVSTFTFYYLIK